MRGNQKRYLYIEGYQYGLIAWGRTVLLYLRGHEVRIGDVGFGWVVVWIGREG